MTTKTAIILFALLATSALSATPTKLFKRRILEQTVGFLKTFNEEEQQRFAAGLSAKGDNLPTGIMKCAWIDRDTFRFFSFYNLQAKNGYTASQPLDGQDANINFNMCTTDRAAVDQSGCAKDTLFGFVKYDNKCYPVGDLDVNIWTFDVVLKEDNKSEKSVDYVKMQSLPKNTTVTQSLATTIVIKCDTNATGTEKPTFSFTNAANGTFALGVNFVSASACGTQSVNKLFLLFNSYKVFPVLFLIVSIPLIFFGLKFIKISLATVGFIVGLIVVSFITSIFANFLNFGVGAWIGFTAGALIVAVILAYLCYQSPNIAVLIAGSAFGYFVGSKLIELGATTFQLELEPMVNGIIIGVCIVLGFILAWKVKKHTIILCTSFGGSQLLVLGLGILLKNYPDYNTISYLIRTKQYHLISTWTWIYLIGSIVVFIAGATVQFKHYTHPDEHDSDDTDFVEPKSGPEAGYY